MIFAIEAAHAGKADRTGVEEYCFQMIQQFKKIIPSTVRVILYTSAASNQELFGSLPENWEVKVLRWPLRKLWSQFRLSWEFFLNPPDVFFAPGQLIPFFCPINTVVMIHDSAFLVYPKAYRLFGCWYLTWMNNRIIKRASLILTSSIFNRAELIKIYGEKIKDTITVVPLAYDSERYKVGSVALPVASEKYGITKPYLIFVGRLEEKKGTKFLVRAFSELKKQSQKEPKLDLQLVLVGKPGAGYTEVKKAIAEHPESSDIIELGYVGSSDLPALITGARAFVFPSLYEGFGIPVLEAMSVGCPVVCSDIPALREVGGGAAQYMHPENLEEFVAALEHVLGNHDVRAKMIAKGLAQVSKFSWAHTATETWGAISQKYLTIHT